MKCHMGKVPKFPHQTECFPRKSVRSALGVQNPVPNTIVHLKYTRNCVCAGVNTLVNIYVDLLVFTRIASTS